ncbi:hypothetical protein Tco_0622289 [Tanacetum coccineum]
MESKLWNLTVKNNDLAAYTQRFQKLTMMCTKMVLEEEDRVEKFIRCLPDDIQGNVIVAEPTKLQDVVHIANNLMDQKLKGYVVKNAKNKRRLEVNQRDNRGKQPPFKRHNGGQMWREPIRLVTMRKRDMMGLCLTATSVSKFHHEGPCIVRCKKYKKVGYLTQDCMATDSTTSNKRGQVVNQRFLTRFECGMHCHYRNDFPKLKDQNRGNKTGNKNGVGEARGKSYVLVGGDANPDSNVVTDVSYTVELADGRISETNTILRAVPSCGGSLCDEKITQKYIKKGCRIFLALITKKETEDKSENKRLEDVPIVREFPKVFPEDFPRLPPMRQVEFQIDLVPGAAPVARARYRLAPTELQELSVQL